VRRYSVETLVDGVWTGKRTYGGNTYTYTEGTSPATARLRWLGESDGMSIIIR